MRDYADEGDNSATPPAQCGQRVVEERARARGVGEREKKNKLSIPDCIKLSPVYYNRWNDSFTAQLSLFLSMFSQVCGEKRQSN